MGLGTSPSIEWNHSKTRFRLNGLPVGRQSRCRWELAQASSGTKVPVGTQPKRQNPSRIGTFEPAKSKDGWGWKAWQHHWALAQASSGTIVPVGTQPKRQNPSKIQAKRVAIWSAEPVPFGTFEPAKSKESKDRWGWALAQASSGTIARQDSGQTGCHLVGRAGAVWHLRTR